MSELTARAILVVEDSYYLAMDVKQTLKDAGAQVIGPFSNSRAALKSLEEKAPDCAILDVNLGQGASFEVARVLRAREIPFLFFTGYDRSALPAEFCDVERLEKPVDNVRLLRALERCCGLRTAPGAHAPITR